MFDTSQSEDYLHDPSNNADHSTKSALQRLVTGLFGVLFLIGAVLAFRSSRQVANLRDEYQALKASFVDFDSIGQEAVHLIAIPEKEPWSYAWRVHTAPMASLPLLSHELKVGREHPGGGLRIREEQDFMARLRIYANDDTQQAAVYHRFAGEQSFSTIASIEFLRFLEDHRDQLVIEQLATDKQVVLAKRGEKVTLLKIEMSMELAEIARAQFPDADHLRHIPTVLEWELFVR